MKSIKIILLNVLRDRENCIDKEKKSPFYFDERKKVILYRGLKFSDKIEYIPIYDFSPENSWKNLPSFKCITNDFLYLWDKFGFSNAISFIKENFNKQRYRNIKFENVIPLLSGISENHKHKYRMLLQEKLKNTDFSEHINNYIKNSCKKNSMIKGRLKVKNIEIVNNSIIYTVVNNYNGILYLTPLDNIVNKDLIILTNILFPFENKIICKTNEYLLKYYETHDIISGLKTANNNDKYNLIYHVGDDIVNFVLNDKKERKSPTKSVENFKLFK